MWRNEKLCTQWKSGVIPFAIGRNTLQQDTWAEAPLCLQCVFSNNIGERGRAGGLKLCNYEKKAATQDFTYAHNSTVFPYSPNLAQQAGSICPERKLPFWLNHCRMCSLLCDVSSCTLERLGDTSFVQHVDWVLVHLVQITLLFEGGLNSFYCSASDRSVVNCIAVCLSMTLFSEAWSRTQSVP